MHRRPNANELPGKITLVAEALADQQRGGAIIIIASAIGSNLSAGLVAGHRLLSAPAPVRTGRPCEALCRVRRPGCARRRAGLGTVGSDLY